MDLILEKEPAPYDLYWVSDLPKRPISGASMYPDNRWWRDSVVLEVYYSDGESLSETHSKTEWLERLMS